MIRFKVDTHDVKYWAKNFKEFNNNLPPEVLQPVVGEFLRQLIDNTPLQNYNTRMTWLQWCRFHCSASVYGNLLGKYSHNVGMLRRGWVMPYNAAKSGTETNSSQLESYIASTAQVLSKESERTNTQVWAKYSFSVPNSAPYYGIRDGDGHSTLLPIWNKGERISGKPAVYSPLSDELMLEDISYMATRVLISSYYKGLRDKGLT